MTRRAAVRLALSGIGWLALLAAAPASAQPVVLERVASIAAPANILAVEGRYAYVAAGKTLAVFDIANPAEPKQTGAYTFPQQVWGITPAGALVYVAADIYGLAILHISEAGVPTLRGVLKTPGQAKGVTLARTRAFVADHTSGVDVVDVADATRPVLIESFFVEGFAKDVTAADALLYAVDMPTGFTVFDLAKPGPLQSVSAVQSATVSVASKLAAVTTIAGRKHVALVGGGVLQVFDVANPEAPVRAAVYRTPSAANRVSVDGSLAYVASVEGLLAVDLSTPAAPGVAAVYKTAKPARDVAVSGSLIFVVVGGDEVQILRRAS